MAPVLIGLLASLTHAQGADKHGHSDSRMPFVHRIFMLDEQGNTIDPKKENPRPYSPMMTCGKCHDYESISHGYHFNAAEKTAPHGRPGEPWILMDPTTRTQLPLSFRGWKGTWNPRDIAMSDWQFVRNFARHLPGGGVGGTPATQPVDKEAHWTQSGKLAIDCMICHSAGNSYDPTDRELQLRNQNYRYSPTRALNLASIKGSVAQVIEEAEAEGSEVTGENWLRVVYNQTRFDLDNRVTMDVVRKPPASACYYCHTTNEVGEKSTRWHSDTDVHLASGLNCADCHRNDLDHATVRGYEGEARDRHDATVAQFSCAGCHLGTQQHGASAEHGDQEAAKAPSTQSASAGHGPAGRPGPMLAMGGNLGAPIPGHKGFPPIHFEKLSCTACHSGPFPEKEGPVNVQTSMAHGLGIESFSRNEKTMPLIVAPVFLRDQSGKIAPHKMVWPNFWARLKDTQVTPIPVKVVTTASKGILPNKRETAADAWNPLTEEQITKVLSKLNEKKDDGEAVYISGGKMTRLTGDGKLTSSEHASAQAYAWPLAHDVRPAAQSLGVRGCADCHSMDAAIYWGEITSVGPFPEQAAVKKAMHELRGEDAVLPRTFAGTFAFRNMLKATAFASAAIILGVLLYYSLRGLGALSRALTHEGELSRR